MPTFLHQLGVLATEALPHKTNLQQHTTKLDILLQMMLYILYLDNDLDLTMYVISIDVDVKWR